MGKCSKDYAFASNLCPPQCRRHLLCSYLPWWNLKWHDYFDKEWNGKKFCQYGSSCTTSNLEAHEYEEWEVEYRRVLPASAFVKWLFLKYCHMAVSHCKGLVQIPCEYCISVSQKMNQEAPHGKWDRKKNVDAILTCCVIVLPPPLDASDKMARASPLGSIPWCSKNLRSSDATTACHMVEGISLGWRGACFSFLHFDGSRFPL